MGVLWLLVIHLVLQVNADKPVNGAGHCYRCFISFINFLTISMCAGARCVATLLHEMKKRGKDCRFGVVSMCIGITYSPKLHIECCSSHFRRKIHFLSCSFNQPKLPFSVWVLTRWWILCFLGSGMGAAAVFEQGGAVDQLSNARAITQNNLLSRDAK